jgi:hypothetical protein
MTGFSAFTEYASSVAAFFLSADQRLLALRETVQATSEDEDASASDKMIANGIGLWLDTVDFWMGLVPSHGGGGLPTMAIVSPLVAAGDKVGAVAITPPGIGAVLAVTALTRVGGTETLATSNLELSPDRRTLHLTVTVPEPAEPPAAVAGLYSALVYALPETPVANVQVVLTE